MKARVRVVSTFTATQPAPLFLVAVETLEGRAEPGDIVNIPLGNLSLVVPIIDTGPVRNELGLELTGLVLQTDDDEERELFDALGIGDEEWLITAAPTP